MALFIKSSILYFRINVFLLDKYGTYCYVILDPATLGITRAYWILHLKELEIMRIMIFLIVSKLTNILLLRSRNKPWITEILNWTGSQNIPILAEQVDNWISILALFWYPASRYVNCFGFQGHIPNLYHWDNFNPTI